MKDYCPGSFSVSLFFLLALSICALSGCSRSLPEASQAPVPVTIQLAPPAPISAGNLSPGLSVIYTDKFYRRISQMPAISQAKATGKRGRPVLQLNHQAGKEGLVFDSGKKKGVGMILTGYLHLAEPGVYRFQALSNDGIECILGDKQIFVDPDVHKDRLSPVGIVDIRQEGWYPLSIRYFQRKGTSALKLYWQPPGAGEFSIIPQEIFAHSNNGQGRQ